MCVAVPLQIKDIHGHEATGEALGAKRTIRIDLIKDLKPGDYVIVHAGIAISKIHEQEAKENLDIIRDVIAAEEKCAPYLCTDNTDRKGEENHAAGL